MSTGEATVILRLAGGGRFRLASPREAASAEALPLLVSVSDAAEAAAIPARGETGEAPSVEIVLDDAGHQAVDLIGIPLGAVAEVAWPGDPTIAGEVVAVALADGRMRLAVES